MNPFLEERISPAIRIVEREELRRITNRPPHGHKGTFGTVLIVGGTVGMCGAVAFAARSAYRAGTGIVRILTSDQNRIPLQVLVPEAPLSVFDEGGRVDADAVRALTDAADAVVLGCGLGQSDHAAELCATVIENCRTPLILDADGLNLLAAHEEWTDRLGAGRQVILTPHMGEGARLLGMSLPAFLSVDRFTAARQIARKYGAVCVLKDALSAVSDGEAEFTQRHGNHGMATGGSGDCLAGILGSLFAQLRGEDRLSPAYIAALGVLLHALAGDDAAARLGACAVMASDIAASVGNVLRDL